MFENSQDDVFILWQNEPTVVIGKNQNAYAEINMDYLREKKIKVARRITGGGAVFHDLGNVNYTYISGSRDGINFEYYSRPIIEALSSLGLSVHLSGRNDLLTEDNKKISGSAEYTKNGRTLHHGTLLFDSRLETLSSVLNVDPEKLKANAVKSTRSRVANIRDYLNENITLTEFIERLEGEIVKMLSPKVVLAPENEQITELYKRNASTDWLFPEKDFLSVYNIIKRKKFDFGLVELNISLKNETVQKISIKGDFFEIKDTEELSELLLGKKITEIEDVISEINIADYIFGMCNDDFLNLIKK
jgi:lipoate-protein ligase A